jgi:hypothetical protein
LLEYLLGDQAGDLRLYSRPAAWADVVITREVLGGEQEDLAIEDLRLKVQCDFFRKSVNQVDLLIDVSDGFAPNLVLDRLDGAGRQDGRGATRRVYTRGERVTIEAQPVYGAYSFDRWTDERGRDLTPPAHSPSLSLTLEGHVTVLAAYLPAAEARPFRRGDSNSDRAANISDAVHILAFLFQGAPEPGCLSSADVNDDGRVDISDPIALLRFLFLGGAPVPAPYGACGPDPTPDTLTCLSAPICP